MGMTEKTRAPLRHPLWVRVTHWLNAAAFLTLAVSGTAILMALPRLFWGETGANEAPAWIHLPLPLNKEQTGWGRNLHFLAAWIFVISGLVYLSASILGGHLYRRLLPDADQLHPTHLRDEFRRHMRLFGPAEPEPGPSRYNALQKLAYVAVVLVLAPVMLLSGLTMSPGVTAAYPELFTLFGGRQSARTIHFLTACVLVLFLLVHLWQVFVNDPWKLLRGMTIGRSAAESEKA